MDTIEGTVNVNYKNQFTLKGEMLMPEIQQEYMVIAEEVTDPKYGIQYRCVCLSLEEPVLDPQGKRKFLERLFTDLQIDAMYDAYSEPFDIFCENDASKLVQIKGCGIRTSIKWQKKFNDSYALAQIFSNLSEYNLSNSVIDKLVDTYQYPEVIIQKVRDNPYILCNDVKGIGWSTADKIAMSNHMKPDDPKRISAFMLYYLRWRGENGYSYITTDELMGAILTYLGEDIPDEAITESIHKIENKLWWNDEKTNIGLKFYEELETNIAKELIRIRDAESVLKYPDNIAEIIKTIEDQQGWEFTDQQIEGIKSTINNNIVCITGYAGTGKTSIAQVVLEISNTNNFAITALSGRAAARIGELTHQEGKTIHRLLGYPMGDKEYQNFYYNQDVPLDYDIIIVDEISMINGVLFYDLLRAVKSGTKLILLGDVGQLEAIGECKIAADIISSPEIPTIFLDKIHRQAEKSANVTESYKIRHGTQIISKKWVGTETRGELQDFIIDCYSDKSNTFYKVMQHFNQEVESGTSIYDIQVLAPVKQTGDASVWNFNIAIQSLYNPKDKDKKELLVHYNGKQSCYLRESDKVINTQNNYKTMDIDGKYAPIFNGNIGTITEIDEDEEIIIVDFYDLGKVVIPFKNKKNISLAYATTIHKYQGSQSPVIICAIDFSAYVMLSRELLYTAITRAQDKCILVAQNDALCYATDHENLSTKTSHLVNKLDEIAHPPLRF